MGVSVAAKLTARHTFDFRLRDFSVGAHVYLQQNLGKLSAAPKAKQSAHRQTKRSADSLARCRMPLSSMAQTQRWHSGKRTLSSAGVFL